MIASKRQNGIHVHWQAINMHNHDRFRAWRDSFFDLIGSHVPCLWIAVDDNRRRARPQDGGSARNDRECGQYDLVACAQAERSNGGVESGGAIADGNAMLAADTRGELLFQSAHKWSLGRYPAVIYTLGKVSLFVAVQQRLIDRHDICHFSCLQ